MLGNVMAEAAEWTVYTSDNSGLPDNRVNEVKIDDDGNIWVGTEKGLARFDGTNWATWNPANSGLPFSKIRALAVDGQGNVWVGQVKRTNQDLPGGLARFDRLFIEH